MKKIAAILTLTFVPYLLSGCMSSVPSSVTAGSYPYPTPSALAVPSAVPSDSLGNLGAGNLPDAGVSAEEQQLANLLNKKVQVSFPLKLGVLLYRENTSINSQSRKDLYNNFIERLKTNPDVGTVQEIPTSLINNGTSIEDLRKLAARFQVSTLLIINDTYQPATENNDITNTPIDIVSGNKNWLSYSNIEVFALDVLNGVFVASGSVKGQSSDKYNKDNPTDNKDETLLKNSSSQAWSMLTDKVNEQIIAFKNSQQGITSTPTPTPVDTPEPSVSPSV